jgi:hypothetical protein
MRITELTNAQAADVIGEMNIETTTDMGATIAHRGNHPTLGEIVAVSSAVGASLIISGA